MRAVVTGGAGFIGSHLVDRLVDEGNDVLVLDDLSTGSPENVSRGATLVRIDLVDGPVQTELERFRPQIVYHVAAQPGVVPSIADPATDARINVLGTLAVLDACAATGVRKVVYASTGGAGYGQPKTLPVTEAGPWNPISPYGISKTVAHRYLSFYREVHGLEFTTLALANIYGPRQDPGGEAGVVAIWLRRLLAGEPCVVYGDGEQTRDFLYVDDAIEAFTAASTRADGLLVNVGTGVETSVNELYRMLASATGVSRPAEHTPSRPGELRRIALDVSLARETLDWQPRVSLADGLIPTVDWFRGSRS